VKTSAVICGLSLALFAAPAGAAGGKFGGGSAGGGGSSVGGGHEKTGESMADVGATTGEGEGLEREKKPWELYAVWETHRLIRQNDLNGDANNKLFNFFYVYPHYDLTDRDRVSFRAGFYQRFLADQGETGLRFDDFVLAYTRFVPLPEKFLLRVTPWVTLPTSFDSKLAGIVTVPRLAVRLDKEIDRFTTRFIGYDEYYVVKWRTANNGATPNPQWHAAALVEGEYRVPYLESLSLGVSLAMGWTWYYGVDAANNPGAQTQTAPGCTVQQCGNQPMSQSYGGELFARWEFPSYQGLASDLTLSYGEGDPTLGYTSVLHDGVRNPYFGFNRHVSEVYLALSARY
jgi:hypothetical protein